MADPTILAAVTSGILRAAAAAGADPAALLASAGLTEADFADPDSRTPLKHHFRVLEAIAALPRPIGLEIGRHLGVEGLGVVGYAMQHEATVRDALAWLDRYRAVVFEDMVGRVERRVVGDRACFVFVHVVPPRLVRLREPADAWAASVVTVTRALTDAAVAPLALALPHPAPADPKPHRAFFRCPIAWSAPTIEIAFDEALLDRPLARSDPHLFRYLARRAEELHAGLPAEAKMIDRVRRLIEEQLPHGEPTLDDVARRLAVSARTLHRRLRDEGAGFSELLDEARRERACRLLADPNRTVAEVAFLLGYAEPTAFFRAFRRWSGDTPQAYRKRTSV